MDWLEAGAVVVGIEKRQLLLAVRGIIGVVDVEHNAMWRPRKAPAIKIDLAEADACERAPVGQVLEPRERRLAHQVGTAFGRPADRDLQGWIALESINIVTVLVAGRDHHHPCCRHLGVAVSNAARVALVAKRSCNRLRQTQARSNLA